MRTREEIQAGVEQIQRDLELEPGQLHMEQEALRGIGSEVMSVVSKDNDIEYSANLEQRRTVREFTHKEAGSETRWHIEERGRRSLRYVIKQPPKTK